MALDQLNFANRQVNRFPGTKPLSRSTLRQAFRGNLDDPSPIDLGQIISLQSVNFNALLFNNLGVYKALSPISNQVVFQIRGVTQPLDRLGTFCSEDGIDIIGVHLSEISIDRTPKD